MDIPTWQCGTCGRSVADRLTVCPGCQHDRSGALRESQVKTSMPAFVPRSTRADVSGWELIALGLAVGVLAALALRASDATVTFLASCLLACLGVTLWAIGCVVLGVRLTQDDR